MRFVKAGLALAVVLSLVLALGAEAGGKGAVHATIYEASQYTVWINYPNEPPVYAQRTLGDGDAVGFAIFNAKVDKTGDEPVKIMKMMVKVQDGPANMEFAVTVVPGIWGAGPLSLTTDGKGKGSLTTELEIPAQYVNNGAAAIKVILTNTADPDEIYATDSRDPPFVNPPDDPNPGSTTHIVNLK